VEWINLERARVPLPTYGSEGSLEYTLRLLSHHMVMIQQLFSSFGGLPPSIINPNDFPPPCHIANPSTFPRTSFLLLLGSTVRFRSSNSRHSPLLHWRGALSALPDLQHLANTYDIICIQESFLSSSSTFNIPGFNNIRSDMTAPGVRGLCTLIRSDYLFLAVDCSSLFHSSLEIMGVNLYCSLDAPILIFNL